MPEGKTRDRGGGGGEETLGHRTLSGRGREFNLFAALRGEREELQNEKLWFGVPAAQSAWCQWAAGKDPYIPVPVGPRQENVEFLIDTGALICLLNKQQADELGIRPSGKTGAAENCPTARTQLWLPGERRMAAVEVALSPYEGKKCGGIRCASGQMMVPPRRQGVGFRRQGGRARHPC